MIEEPIRSDFYIRLTSEADMPTVFHAFYTQDTETTVDPETGEETTVDVGDPYLIQNTPDYALDVVGVIHKPTGVILTDADGNEYPEMTALTAWHLNIRLLNDTKRTIVESIDELYGVTPGTPNRLWL
jgi:hypothetical protein